MKEDTKKKLQEAVSRKIQTEETSYLFEGIDTRGGKSLEEFFESNAIEDYVWDEDLEDALYSEEDLDEAQGDQLKTFGVGDIIMTKKFKSKGRYIESPHRVLIITSKKTHQGNMEYSGFLFSTQMSKSNKYGGYPNNIYIKNYASILDKGAPYSKEAFLRVDDIVTFTSEDLDVSGTWKGKVSKEFESFLQTCYNNYRKGISNATMYWEH